jgi:GNAT superfamily N-acetyltransferase
MGEIQVRTASPADETSILDLLAAAMGREPDPRFQWLFRWKHQENPFGPSRAWVAVVEGRIAGYRALLRWEFNRGGGVQRAVRAVDTATSPDHQGLGIFRTLTLHALEQMAEEGVEFVFNTPNERSRPGYLKMGWEPVGQLRPMVRPRSPMGLPTILRGRVPASHWGEPTTVGADAADVFADDAAVEELLSSLQPKTSDGRLRTRRSAAYLRWRYDAGPLGYRVLTLGRDLREGAACFRLRQRGPAVEATIGDLLVPGGEPAIERRLLARLLGVTRADYALVLGHSWRSGLLPVPGQGPTLVWRQLQDGLRPSLDRWALTMGDIELF